MPEFNDSKYLGHFFKVIDITGTLVASGKCTSIKVNWNGDSTFDILPLISFDNKYHFIFKGNDNYKVVECDPCEEILAIPKHYKITLWRELYTNLNSDIYREYGEDELDKEVQYLVKQLNQIPDFITTGSCSGHNEKPLFVYIIVNSETSAKLFSFILEKEFPGVFKFEVSRNCIRNSLYKLETYKIGKEAYKSANCLGNALNRYLGLF